MADLRAVPTLDELAARPERAVELPAEARRRIVSRLAALILALETNGPSEADLAPESKGHHCEPRLLDAKEAAARLGVPESWVRDMARQGKLLSVRLGHYVRFRPEDLDALVAEHRR